MKNKINDLIIKTNENITLYFDNCINYNGYGIDSKNLSRNLTCNLNNILDEIEKNPLLCQFEIIELLYDPKNNSYNKEKKIKVTYKNHYFKSN